MIRESRGIEANMRALFSSSASSSIRISTLPTTLHKTLFKKSRLLSVLKSDIVPFLPFSPLISNNIPKSNSLTTISSSSSSSSTTTTSTISTEAEVAEHHETSEKEEEKFDWYAQWCPVMPVCDLDKRVPHAKKVIGLDIVVWWDRNEGTWKVFEDACPHRLAPLSEGRIDQWGRLQCVYHGWCFNGSGDCKFIPQAPPDGRQIQTSKKACVTVYPSIVYHDIVWFWPNSDPQHKDIILKKQPPTVPELDDPSVLFNLTGNRDFPYGYEVLMENLMDPAHLPYAHYGITSTRQPKGAKFDREGGCPLEFSVKKPMRVDGFIANEDKFGSIKFIAPFISVLSVNVDQGNKSASSAATENKASLKKTDVLIFICIPVSPGNSRLIWVYPKTSDEWTAKLFPRWFFHITVNIILDSDLYLLHVEERRIMDVGNANWQKACFVPTKSDTLVAGFRRWLNKYAGGEIEWRGKYTGALPTTSPPKDQLLDRYWSHVVNCRSCSAAYKGLNALDVVLQVASVAFVGFIAATKQNVTSVAARNTMAVMAVVCFAGSRWLAHFIYKNFRFHDYNHAHV